MTGTSRKEIENTATAESDDARRSSDTATTSSNVALDLAHPLRRLYAYLIDIGILLMVVFLIARVAGGWVASGWVLSQDPRAAVIDVFIFFGYFVFSTGIFGRTPGKWVAGIKVVDEDGLTPGVGVAIPREMVGRFVSVVAIGAGLLWMLFDKNRQGWHDKIAGTYVVNTGGSGLLSRLFVSEGDGASSSSTDKGRSSANKSRQRAVHHVGRPAVSSRRSRRRRRTRSR